uniref:Peptidase A1 domain-containing protein n=1 Tax=Sus scrofa TaxID=9823 RepID=A0A8D0Y732_PIG
MIKPGPRQALALCKLMASPCPPTPQPIPSSASQTVTSEQTLLPQVGDLIIKNQAFGISLAEDDMVFENAVFDGVLGLGYPSLALEGTTPIFDTIMNQSLISEPVFAFYLSTETEAGSVVMFGGVLDCYYKGDLKWVPLSQTQYWQIPLDRITIKPKFVACKRRCQAILDTGTSSLTGPRRQVYNIHKLIPGYYLQDLVKDQATGSFRGSSQKQDKVYQPRSLFPDSM